MSKQCDDSSRDSIGVSYPVLALRCELIPLIYREEWFSQEVQERIISVEKTVQ